MQTIARPNPERSPAGRWLQRATDTSWSLRILLLLALLLPGLFAAVFAVRQHAGVLDQAKATARRAAVALEQHADNVFQVHALILSHFAGATEERDWQEIADDRRLRQSLREAVAGFPQVSLIALADAQGRVRTGSPVAPEWPMVAARDYFQVHREGAAQGVYFSNPFIDPVTSQPHFAVSIARRDASGGFDGIVFLTVPVAYFTGFWRQFTPGSGYMVPMVREDGMIVVRFPAADGPDRVPADSPVFSLARQTSSGVYVGPSAMDGVERINAYRRIGHTTLYISYSVETRVAMQPWRESVLAAALAALAVTCAAVTLVLLVMRESHRQRTAARRWQEIADNLEHEKARREEAEAALRQGQKMEAVGQLTGGIAHDFNNLLAGISGNLQMMRIRLDQGRQAQLLGHIDAAESVADKAAAITQRLLAFSRRQKLSPSPCCVNRNILAMQDLIARTVGPSIRLRTRLRDDAWNTYCDQHQLDSALLNLCINARDAMPDGGRLTIATANEVLDDADVAAGLGLPCGRYVTVEIEDTGTGMLPEVAQRAFDPFFTTKPAGHGTGLGLSMVYGFVKQSRGGVSIDSAPGEGTAIRIYLPCHAGEPARDDSPAQAPGKTPAAAGATIVLVDDEEPLRVVLTKFLDDQGYRVRTAHDAAAALEVLRNTPSVQLFVTDIGLPGTMNGKKLADVVKVLYPDLQVLFITGYVDQAKTGDILMETGMEVLSKPFRLDVFGAKVRDLLQAAPAELDTRP